MSGLTSPPTTVQRDSGTRPRGSWSDLGTGSVSEVGTSSTETRSGTGLRDKGPTNTGTPGQKHTEVHEDPRTYERGHTGEYSGHRQALIHGIQKNLQRHTSVHKRVHTPPGESERVPGVPIEQYLPSVQSHETFPDSRSSPARSHIGNGDPRTPDSLLGLEWLHRLSRLYVQGSKLFGETLGSTT